MRPYRHIIRLCCVILTLMLTSCVHKELCYDHPHTATLEVIFDWEKAEDAAPETMSLYLFPQDGGKVERYEFTDHNGGKIKAQAGEYKAICLNSDTRNISLEDKEAFETFRMTAADAEPSRVEDAEDELIAQSPDKIWTDNIEHLVIDENTGSIRMTPEKSFIRFNIEVYNVENLEYAHMISGVLTTLSESFLPGKEVLSEENVTIPFSGTPSLEDCCIRGGLHAFGHCPSEANGHFLILYVTMSDGAEISFRYDVTEQIHNAPDPENIVIVLNGLKLPEAEHAGGTSGGLTPDVDEWTSVDIEIKM